jgi:hypothetical protein
MLAIRLPLGRGACGDDYQARLSDTQRPRLWGRVPSNAFIMVAQARNAHQNVQRYGL